MTEKFQNPTCFADIMSGGFDRFGLLSDVKPTAKASKPRDVVEQNFMEVVKFYETEGHVPQLDVADMRERRLATRLKAYRSRPDLRARVKPLDAHGLLEAGTQKEQADTNRSQSFSSFEDIFKKDNSGLLQGIDPSIFKLEHVTDAEPDMRNLPDEIASRKKCEDFFRFEKLFSDTQHDILNNKAMVVRFKNETQLEVGDIFVLGGLLCLVDCVLEDSKESARRDNPRYRVIFENGIETNILKLSFARALYKDPHGRRILPELNLEEKFAGITHRDKATGCIYILASETKAPELAELKRRGTLVKIGYSSQSVAERVKYAAEDPTYLEAPVRILATLDCYNLNPQKVEHLIHAFLAKQRINMTLISSKGRPYRPTEWFAVDRDTAIAVAEHIVAGDIMNYRMDNTTGKIKQITTTRP